MEALGSFEMPVFFFTGRQNKFVERGGAVG
jgi:hypothetical protein